MKVDDSKSRDLKFGTNTTTWKDIGVDLCDKKKGGWGWARGWASDMVFHLDEVITIKPKGRVKAEKEYRWAMICIWDKFDKYF